MSKFYKASSICVNHDMGDVQDNLACTPEAAFAVAHAEVLSGDFHQKMRRSLSLNRKALRKDMGTANWRKSSKQLKALLETKLDPQALFGVRTPLDDVKDAATNLHNVNARLTEVFSKLAYPGSGTDQPYENLVCRLQDLSAMMIILSNATSLPVFVATIVLYVRTFYTGVIGESTVVALISYVKDTLFSSTPAPNEDESRWEDLHLQAAEGFSIPDFRKIFENWKEGRHSLFAKKCADVVSIFVSIGFFPDVLTNGIQFKGFKLFAAKVWDIQNAPIDFFEMIADTVIYFAENAYHAISTGDFSVFMYNDRSLIDIERKYAFFISALPLLDAGKIEQAIDAEQYGITTEHDFVRELEVLMTKFTDLIVVEKRQQVKAIYQSKYIALSKVRSMIVASIRDSCVRMSPFAVLIYGGSSIAKSTMDVSICKVLAHANGFPSGKESICTLNDRDKFQSEFKAHHTVIRLDDLCNARAETYDTSPLAILIDLLNNVPRAALKADVESKGNVMFNPRIVTATTNQKDLMAHLFSNAPGSILRRFHYVLTPTLRDEFINPETGGFNSAMATDDLVPDYWRVNLEHVKLIRRGGDRADSYEYVRIGSGMSFPEVLDYLQAESIRHFEQQKRYVSTVEKQLDLVLCEHSREPLKCQRCRYEAETRHAELAFFNDERSIPSNADSHAEDIDSLDESSVSSNSDSSSLASDDIPLEVQGGDLKGAAAFLGMTDDEMIKACDVLRQSDSDMSYKDIADAWSEERGIFGALLDMAHLPINIVTLYHEHKKSLLACALSASAVLASAYAVAKMFSMHKSIVLATQSSAVQMPEPFEEKVNVWAKPVLTPIPVSKASTSTSVDDLVDIITRNLAHLLVTQDGDNRTSQSDIFPAGGNVWIMPNHMVRDGPFWVHVRTSGEGIVGRINFKELVDKTAIERIPGTDFALVILTKGGSLRDLTKFFLQNDAKIPAGMMCRTVYKARDATVQQQLVRILQCRAFESAACKFAGMSYNYRGGTFMGQCMMPLVSNTMQPSIIGFHICGKTGLEYGVAGMLSKESYDKTLATLKARYPLDCHSEGALVLNVLNKEYNLGPLKNERHPVFFMQNDEQGEEPLLTIYGEHDMGTARFKSQVKKSVISDAVTEVMHIPRLHGPPDARCFNKHYQRDLHLMAHPKGDVPPAILKRCIDDMSSKFLDFLSNNAHAAAMVHPMPDEVVLAGADGITFVESLDLNTSVGFPLNKPKSNYLERTSTPIDGISNPVRIIDDADFPLLQAISDAEDILARGERVHFVHRANLKDEPTKFGKDKIRVFAGSSIVLVALYRKYFLGYNRLTQRFPAVFETAVGMNCYGPDWHEYARHLCQFAEEPDVSDVRIVDGDFKAFDKRIPAAILRGSFEVTVRVMEYCGYTPRQLQIARGLATECCYPLYELAGVLVQTNGSSPSGYPGTVVQNGCGGGLYLRIPFFEIYGVDTPMRFHEHVALTSVGDDHTAGVSKSVPEYNMISICKVLGSYGIAYTAADKTAITVPYDGINEAQFLKRHFRFDREIGKFLAPLEKDSMGKSLHNYMHRKNAIKRPEEISADALLGALREHFQYGRDEYDAFRNQIMPVAEAAGITEYMPALPTYEYEKARYFTKPLDKISENSDEDLDLQSCETVLDYSPRLAKGVPVRKFLQYLLLSMCLVLTKNCVSLHRFGETNYTLGPGNNFRCLGCTMSKSQSSEEECSLAPIKSADLRRFSSQSEANSPEYIETPYEGVLDPHSGEANEHGVCTDSASSYTLQQNLMFTDMNPAYESCVESHYDSLRMSMDNDDASLGNFFSRPIRIFEMPWLLNTDVFSTFNPWELYFGNPRVVNRISNFFQMRAKLHVKFVLNGNPFYYGRAMVTYLPLPQVDQITVFRNNVSADFVEASQRPRVFLDPSNSQGAEMILPFVYHLNNCAITGAQYTELGDLTIASLSDLKHANGATNPLSIQVWAWAEDVHLSVPTSQNPNTLVPQSLDEYGQGVISKPASTAARVASKLTNVPYIGRFAKATEIGASAVSGVAQLFGYSKPTNISAHQFMTPVVGNMANTMGEDCSTKLSLDPKQELSVDPMLTGLGSTDEMTIRSISTRESYLTSFTLSPSNAADDVLWSCAVTPTLWVENIDPLVNEVEYHLTAMCFATLPFKYWRGNIKYRFMIASSGMHKGRLRIVYDPQDLDGVEFNVNYSSVVDIAESRDFTISVGHAQTPAVLNHETPQNNPGVQLFTNGAIVPPTARDDRNGVIAVYVANELTVPNSTINNDIQIHVFVSTDDNFEVFVPDATSLSNASWFTPPAVGARQLLDPQSMETGAEGTSELGKTEQDAVLHYMAPKQTLSDNLTSVHIGEEITSFRNVVKRYLYARYLSLKSVGLETGTSYYSVAWKVSNFPHHRGFAYPGFGIHETSTGLDYNYVKMTMLNYLTPAYVCRRGGIRYKTQLIGTLSVDPRFSVTRRAQDDEDQFDEVVCTALPTRGVPAATRFNQSRDTQIMSDAATGAWGGSVIQHFRTNGVLEYELPFQSNNRYSPGKRMDFRTSIIDKGRDNYYHALITTVNLASTAAETGLDMYVAGGEDFSLSFYTGPPILYVLNFEPNGLDN